MIARITSSPEPSNHSIALALPSNIQPIFHKAPNKSGASLIIELTEVFVGEQPNNTGNYDQSELINQPLIVCNEPDI